MVDYPDPISAYLLGRLTSDLDPVYFLIDDQGMILSWGGRLERYDIPTPEKGMRINDLLFFTEGLLPMTDPQLVVECVAWADGHVVDVHLFRDKGQLWLLLIDAHQKAEDRHRAQQRAHELRLLNDSHTRILDQHQGKGATARLSDIAARRGARRYTLSILFADIRRFTSFCEHRPPNVVFETLNTYLSAMIQPVLDCAGLVDKLVGDAVMGVFGLVPSTASAPTLAVRAAKAIIDNTRRVGLTRQRMGEVPLSVGVGIATGPVVLGMIGSKDRKTLSVTGHSVNLAARLESQAAGAELLIDATTMDALQTNREAFTARRLTLRGMNSSITAYGWTMENGN